MGLSGIRQITTNPYGGCATQGPVGGTWCWGNVAALIGRQQGDTPRPIGFPPTRIEGFDDMEAVTLDMPYELRPPFLAGITVRRTVICRGHNYSFVCGAVSSDGLARTLIWGVE